ncbi:MAG: NAD(P)H-dependent oxidoreductase subunit E [Chloroflexi bacterium]|nr:NAD(P)H-dependent oxidoreductase subunit E [Chloroflexota bacterium]
MLTEKYHSQIESTLAKYPADQKRSAVMPLLHLAQTEYGYITKDAMQEVADRHKSLLSLASIRSITIIRRVNTTFKFAPTCPVPCAAQINLPKTYAPSSV